LLNPLIFAIKTPGDFQHGFLDFFIPKRNRSESLSMLHLADNAYDKSYDNHFDGST
jgi:hypothetical protein